MFSKEIEDKAKVHAMAEFPKESVGLVVDGVYMPLDNVHNSPCTDFQARIEDYMPYMLENKIEAIIHSHTKKQNDLIALPYPSKLDMQTQMNFNVTFGIVYTDGQRASEILYFGDTVPRLPLEGRVFIHAVQDCYSLIRDFYNEWKGVWIKDFPRNWNWWQNGETLYNSGFESAGFIKIPTEQIEYGSVLLMAVTPDTIRNQNPCHAGIYLGDGKILHHKCNGIPYDKSSVSSIVMGERYMKYVVHALRYVGEGA